MKQYSTVQVAELVGIGNDTLLRWIREKKISAPQPEFVGGIRVRLWTEADVKRLEEYKTKHYWGKGKSRNRRKS
jgi:excisionase family DNA binding protein